jgi:hypothetical protein
MAFFSKWYAIFIYILSLKPLSTLLVMVGNALGMLFSASVFVITVIHTWETSRLLAKFIEKDKPTLIQLIVAQGK